MTSVNAPLRTPELELHTTVSDICTEVLDHFEYLQTTLKPDKASLHLSISSGTES